MFDLVAPSFARFVIAMKFGIAIAARMPMITTTIISSISVKPFATALLMVLGPLLWATPCAGPLKAPQGARNAHSEFWHARRSGRVVFTCGRRPRSARAVVAGGALRAPRRPARSLIGARPPAQPRRVADGAARPVATPGGRRS